MAGPLAAHAHRRAHFFTFFERNRRAIDEFRQALALDPGMQQC